MPGAPTSGLLAHQPADSLDKLLLALESEPAILDFTLGVNERSNRDSHNVEERLQRRVLLSRRGFGQKNKLILRVILDELQRRAALFLHGDRQDLQLSLVFVQKLLQRGHLSHTWTTPGSPESDEGRLAFEIGQL